MSDTESSSGSDIEDVATTGLVATRARRSNAGAAIASILANEELRAAVLEGVEDDAESYAGSDKDAGDDDESMDSSSDEEDGGPPKEGEDEDMTGERELKKAERAEQRKKRKAADSLLKLPAWQKQVKRVKMADDAKREDGSSTPVDRATKSKKKGDRTNRLQNALDGPVRKSVRASAVQNREIMHANLKQEAEKSKKQRKVPMRVEEKEDAKKRRDLTLEERLEKCRKIEKETARELGKWERAEAERQRIREEILAAKRKKGPEGPFIRHWSGSGIYEGYESHWRLRTHRVLPRRNVEEMQDRDMVGHEGADNPAVQEDNADPGENENSSEIQPYEPLPSTAAHTHIVVTVPSSLPISDLPADADEQSHKQSASPPAHGFLEGLEAYACEAEPMSAQASQLDEASPTQVKTSQSAHNSQPADSSPMGVDTSQPAQAPRQIDPSPMQEDTLQSAQDTQPVDSSPMQIETSQPAQDPQVVDLSSTRPEASQPAQVSQPVDPSSIHTATSQPIQPFQHPPSIPQEPSQPSAGQSAVSQQTSINAWPPGSSMFNSNVQPSAAQPLPAAPLPPSHPTLREQAQRSIIILEGFSNLDGGPQLTTTGKVKRRQDSSVGDVSAIRNVLLPNVLPPLTQEQHKYLFPVQTRRNQKLSSLPLLPKQRCAVTQWVPKYRDPKTGLAFADAHAYKVVQRLVAGGMQWSSLLGAWCGPAYGPMGRAARGVPEGFSAKPKSIAKGVDIVKIEKIDD